MVNGYHVRIMLEVTLNGAIPSNCVTLQWPRFDKLLL